MISLLTTSKTMWSMWQYRSVRKPLPQTTTTCPLSVSSYVEAKDTREKIDITLLNAELKTTVAKIDQLRGDIDTIVAEIEGVTP